MKQKLIAVLLVALVCSAAVTVPYVLNDNGVQFQRLTQTDASQAGILMSDRSAEVYVQADHYVSFNVLSHPRSSMTPEGFMANNQAGLTVDLPCVRPEGTWGTCHYEGGLLTRVQ